MLFTYLLKYADLKWRFIIFKVKFLLLNQPCFVGVYSELFVVFKKTIFIISLINKHSNNSNLPPIVVLNPIVLKYCN